MCPLYGCRWLLSCLLLMTLQATACSMNPVSGRPEVTLISVEQEKKIGEEEAKKVEAQMGLLDDTQFHPYLDTLGQRLAKESPRQDVTHQFHVADMAEPNAFALPGGYVYVSRGLLALVNSEDELAGVVGHEIGHVAARHTVQKISKQGPFAAVFGIASGLAGIVSPLAANIIGGVGDLTQGLLFSPYSRSQETEADRVGQEMAAKAGWDPAALSVFLSSLEREVELLSQSKEPRKPSFFDSHPATPDRVKKTAEHAKELKPANRAPISATHESFLARLDGMVDGQRAANGIFEGRTFLHPDMNFLVQFPEKWQHDNTPQKIVAAAPNGEGAVLVGAVAEGTDPMDGAREVEKKTKSDVVAKTEKLTIGDLPAAHTQIKADGKVTLDITWIAHGGLIYQVAGMAPTRQFDTLQPLFHSTAHSFRPLSASERDGIKEKRIRLVKARAGESIEALAARTNSAWKKEQIAVMNNLAVGDQLKEGQVIKVAIAEQYESKKSK
ncbi:MAG TPA: M48 family metalloprotease [Nitrospiraceae bacterium]|nr:M48 family metalloprotease [Nitrospiraceae bacterium]